MSNCLYLLILTVLVIFTRTEPVCSDNYNFSEGWYNFNLIVNATSGQLMRLSLTQKVTANSYQFAALMSPSYTSLYNPHAAQRFYIQSTGDIYSTYGVKSFMSPFNPISNTSDYQLIIFGDLSFLQSNQSKYSSQLSFQNCSDGTYRIYTTLGGNRSYLGGYPGNTDSTQAMYFGNITNIATYFSIVLQLPCYDSPPLSPGWYYINVDNGKGQQLTLTLKDRMETSSWQQAKFVDRANSSKYPNASQTFYISMTGLIYSNLGVQSFLVPSDQISSSSDRQAAFFGDLVFLNPKYLNSMQMYFQNCIDGSNRIYTTYGGNRSYLGIDAGQKEEASAFFAGANYTGQLNKLNIVAPTCQDNYKFPMGSYLISVENGLGQTLVLSFLNGYSTNFYQPSAFVNWVSLNANYIYPIEQVYIGSQGDIYITSYNWWRYIMTIDPSNALYPVMMVNLGSVSTSPPISNNSRLSFQNCSDGTYRIYQQSGSVRNYLAVKAGSQYGAYTTLQSSLSMENSLTNLQIVPFTPVTCADTILSPGRYFITFKDFFTVTYNIITNGIITNNSWQGNKAMEKNYYESRLSTNGSKQFWVENGPENVHYIRNNNAVPSYMSPNSQINSAADSQNAIMGDIAYLNQAKGNRQLYVKSCSDSTYRICSTLGGYISYLGVNFTVSNGGSVFFAGGLYTGQIKQLYIQKLPSTNVQICHSADAVSGNSATFYMTADPQIGLTPFGRYDGDTNAMNTYDFLVTQIKNAKCPQTFVGIAGDMNHQSNGYQDNFHHNDLAAGDKAYFFADLIGKHDILPITSKYSMIPKKLTSNPFYWSNAVSIAHQYYLTVPYSGYQSASATPSITYQTSNSANSYNSYILGLYNKGSPNTKGTPIAYYVAIHNNFDDGKTALIQAKNWYNKQNTTVPIILVSHWVNSFADDNVNGQANMLAFVNSLPVAAILVGHQTCKDAYMDDHCCRRNKPEDHYYANATLKNGTTVPITNSNNRTIPYINTSGVRDRIFFSISLNSTTVQIIRKAWTNGGRYGEFEVDNLKMAPLTYRFA